MNKPSLSLATIPNKRDYEDRTVFWLRTQTAVHFQYPGKGLVQLPNPVTKNSLGTLGALSITYNGKGATLVAGPLEMFIPDANIISVQFDSEQK